MSNKLFVAGRAGVENHWISFHNYLERKYGDVYTEEMINRLVLINETLLIEFNAILTAPDIHSGEPYHIQFNDEKHFVEYRLRFG